MIEDDGYSFQYRTIHHMILWKKTKMKMGTGSRIRKTVPETAQTNHVDGPSRGSHNRNIGAQQTPLTKWHFGLGTPSLRPGPAEW